MLFSTTEKCGCFSAGQDIILSLNLIIQGKKNLFVRGLVILMDFMMKVLFAYKKSDFFLLPVQNL
ncbi:MAG: hypothetical protein CSA18_01050 [Deltaproteobacteria bacterium]|nr:MAG: hypothetical protein CSA18_01050 [Deltaproteobacteria bacterium]